MYLLSDSPVCIQEHLCSQPWQPHQPRRGYLRVMLTEFVRATVDYSWLNHRSGQSSERPIAHAPVSEYDDRLHGITM